MHTPPAINRVSSSSSSTRAVAFTQEEGEIIAGLVRKEKKRKAGKRILLDYRSIALRRDECKIVGEGLTEVSGMCFKRLLNDHAFERLIATIA